MDTQDRFNIVHTDEEEMKFDEVHCPQQVKNHLILSNTASRAEEEIPDRIKCKFEKALSAFSSTQKRSFLLPPQTSPLKPKNDTTTLKIASELATTHQNACKISSKIIKSDDPPQQPTASSTNDDKMMMVEKLCIELADDLYNASHYEEALLIYKLINELNLVNISGYLGQGKCLASLRMYDDAVKVYDTAITRIIASTELKQEDNGCERMEKANLSLRELYVEQGLLHLHKLMKPDLALIFFDNALEIDAQFPDAYFYKGNALAALWKQKNKEKKSTNVNNKEEKDRSRNSSADCGLLEVALDCYELALLYTKERPSAAAINTNKKEEQSIEKESVKSCSNDDDEELLPNQREPFVSACWFNRGNTYMKMGLYEKAYISYGLVKDDADACFNEGNCFRHLGFNHQALKSYEKAINLNPKHSDAIFNKGNTLRDLNMFKEAIDAYDRFIQLLLSAPLDASLAFYNKGNCLFKLGRFEEANRAYEYSILLNSSEKEFMPEKDRVDDESDSDEEKVLHNNNGEEEQNSHPDAAFSLLKNQKQNNVYKAYFNKGLTLIQLQKLSEALHSFEIYLQKYPTDAYALFYKASCILHTRETIDDDSTYFAHRIYQNAKRLNPDIPDLKF